MAKSIDLSIVKVGLEYANFKDYRIRDAMNRLVNQLQLDLEEVAFEPSEQTRKAITDFEDTITEIETEKAPKASPMTIDESETEGVVTRKRRSDDVDEAPRARRVVNVDAELDEEH